MSDYQIIEKATGDKWSTANGRSSWKKSGHAKSAWRLTFHNDKRVLEDTHEVFKVFSKTEQALLSNLSNLYKNYECGEDVDRILEDCIKLIKEI